MPLSLGVAMLVMALVWAMYRTAYEEHTWSDSGVVISDNYRLGLVLLAAATVTAAYGGLLRRLRRLGPRRRGAGLVGGGRRDRRRARARRELPPRVAAPRGRARPARRLSDRRAGLRHLPGRRRRHPRRRAGDGLHELGDVPAARLGRSQAGVHRARRVVHLRSPRAAARDRPPGARPRVSGRARRRGRRHPRRGGLDGGVRRDPPALQQRCTTGSTRTVARNGRSSTGSTTGRAGSSAAGAARRSRPPTSRSSRSRSTIDRRGAVDRTHGAAAHRPRPTRPSQGMRTVRLRVTSTRGAPVVSLVLESVVGSFSAWLDDQPVAHKDTTILDGDPGALVVRLLCGAARGATRSRCASPPARTPGCAWSTSRTGCRRSWPGATPLVRAASCPAASATARSRSALYVLSSRAGGGLEAPPREE